MGAYAKLAADMRKGAALRPQTFGKMFAGYGGKIESCALGASIEGATGDAMGMDLTAKVCACLGWPDRYLQVANPDPARIAGSPVGLYWCITRLNDVCGWSRESIADWLDGLDAKAEVAWATR